MLVGQRKKSQKYFDLSTFNYNLYDSNPCSSLSVMNFQKWEVFSGSPGICDVLSHDKITRCKDFTKNQTRISLANLEDINCKISCIK